LAGAAIVEGTAVWLLRLAKSVTILWILVRPCSYEDTDLVKIQAAIDPEMPLGKYDRLVDREDVYTKVCRRIKKLFES
jgi:hypothetical protein